VPVLKNYVRDHTDSLTMSANADLTDEQVRINPHRSQANLSARAVTSQLHPHTSCI